MAAAGYDETPHQPVRLLDLPRELRDIIWEETRDNIRLREFGSRHRQTRFDLFMIEPSLRLVSQQLKADVDAAIGKTRHSKRTLKAGLMLFPWENPPILHQRVKDLADELELTAFVILAPRRPFTASGVRLDIAHTMFRCWAWARAFFPANGSIGNLPIITFSLSIAIVVDNWTSLDAMRFCGWMKAFLATYIAGIGRLTTFEVDRKLHLDGPVTSWIRWDHKTGWVTPNVERSSG